MTGTGQPEYAIEKLASPVRAMFRALAQTRGWDQAKLIKMNDKDQGLWYFDLPDGAGGERRHFVASDALPAFLDAHRPLKREQGVELEPVGKLLTYTGREAYAAGMATGLATDLPALWKALGADPAEVRSYAPTRTEEISWALAAWAPILAGLAMLCVILEFKFGGNGLFLIGAAMFGLLFAGAQYYQELAGNVEFILIALGAALLLVEFLVFPTGGLLLAGGLGMVGIGLVLAFMPDATQFTPSAPDWGGDLVGALADSTIALLLVGVALLVGIAALPRSRAMRRIAVMGAVEGTSEAAAPAATVLRGTAVSDLRPAGLVRLDGAPADESARADHGAHIPRGTRVMTVERRLGELVVRPEDAP